VNSADCERDVGNNPLEPILRQLQEATRADMVLLGDVVTSPFMRIQTLYCRVDQALQPNFSYVLATHPCEQVITTGKFKQWQDIGAQFPEAYLLHDCGM
jgi:hypothetical protein